MRFAVIVDTLAKAVALRAALATRMGLPLEGANVGGGIHAPASQTRTTAATWFVRHRDGSAQWAVFVPAKVAAWLTEQERGQVVVIGDEWFPPSSTF